GMLTILAFLTTRKTRDAINGVSTPHRDHLWVWAGAIGLAWSLGAAAILLPAHTLLWGNQGDETFQIAFMEKVISGHPFSDFFYANLSPFYPPLYFWIFGTLGRIFNWDGISAAQWGTLITYALLPLVAVLFSKICRWTFQEQKVALLLSIGTLLFLPTEALLLKPYEAAAALFSVLWIYAFIKLLKEPSWGLRIILGISGGIIFLLYYFWFVLLIPAMIGLILSSRRQEGSPWWIPHYVRNDMRSFITIGIITTFVASPFLIPYLYDLITLGQQNYQSVYFFPSDAHLYAPWFSYTFAGLLTIGSIITYIARKSWSDAQKATLAITGSIMLWHFVQLIVLATGGKSVMLSKPFLFLGGVALMLPAIEWIGEWINAGCRLARLEFIDSRKVLIASIIIFAPLLPNGLFLDDTKIQAQLEQNLLSRTSSFVAENIRVFVPDYAQRTWLVSGLQDLNGILPITHYLAWNPHFSHPAAHWGTRLNELERISKLTTANEVTQSFDALGINALLLYRATDENGNAYYPFFYEEDAWPNGTESKKLRFDEKLINLENWQVVHEDNEWRVLLRK
ncbi:MAG: arabinofuranosyltransferase, partial [Patescibacteria group bacterium]